MAWPSPSRSFGLMTPPRDGPETPNLGWAAPDSAMSLGAVMNPSRVAAGARESPPHPHSGGPRGDERSNQDAGVDDGRADRGYDAAYSNARSAGSVARTPWSVGSVGLRLLTPSILSRSPARRTPRLDSAHVSDVGVGGGPGVTGGVGADLSRQVGFSPPGMMPSNARRGRRSSGIDPFSPDARPSMVSPAAGAGLGSSAGPSRATERRGRPTGQGRRASVATSLIARGLQRSAEGSRRTHTAGANGGSFATPAGGVSASDSAVRQPGSSGSTLHESASSSALRRPDTRGPGSLASPAHHAAGGSLASPVPAWEDDATKAQREVASALLNLTPNSRARALRTSPAATPEGALAADFFDDGSVRRSARRPRGRVREDSNGARISDGAGGSGDGTRRGAEEYDRATQDGATLLARLSRVAPPPSASLFLPGSATPTESTRVVDDGTPALRRSRAKGRRVSRPSTRAAEAAGMYKTPIAPTAPSAKSRGRSTAASAKSMPRKAQRGTAQIAARKAAATEATSTPAARSRAGAGSAPSDGSSKVYKRKRVVKRERHNCRVEGCTNRPRYGEGLRSDGFMPLYCSQHKANGTDLVNVYTLGCIMDGCSIAASKGKKGPDGKVHRPLMCKAHALIHNATVTDPAELMVPAHCCIADDCIVEAKFPDPAHIVRGTRVWCLSHRDHRNAAIASGEVVAQPEPQAVARRRSTGTAGTKRANKRVRAADK